MRPRRKLMWYLLHGYLSNIHLDISSRSSSCGGASRACWSSTACYRSPSTGEALASTSRPRSWRSSSGGGRSRSRSGSAASRKKNTVCLYCYGARTSGRSPYGVP